MTEKNRDFNKFVNDPISCRMSDMEYFALFSQKIKFNPEKISYNRLCDTLGVTIPRHILVQLGCSGMERFECNQADLVMLSTALTSLQMRVDSLIVKK